MESKVMDSSLQHAVEVSNHRKMLAAPALKILADPDNSEKSFKVLVSVMERCHREPANQGVFLGAGSSDSERKLGFDFTKWFLGRFTIIFSRQSLRRVHDSFTELHTKILNLFCWREPHQFTMLIQEYIQMLNELTSASYQFSQGKVRPNETVKLNAFVAAKSTKLGPNLELVLDGLAIGSLLECVLLQVNITKIIGSVWEGIVQFQPQVCERLTYTLLKQLDCGGPDLFSVTLNCIRHIVQPDCAARILSVTLSALERLAGLLVDPSEKRTCSASALLEVDDATWVQIEDSLASCLNALARPFGQTSLSNHQFLRLASHIVQQEPYHRSASLDALMPGVVAALHRYPSCENAALFQFDVHLWIRLLGLSREAVEPLELVVRSELSLSDAVVGDSFPEPNAKRPKLDVQVPSLLPACPTLWDRLKAHWKRAPLTDRDEDVAALFRVAVVATKLKLRFRDSAGPVLEEDDVQQFNAKVCDWLPTAARDGRQLELLVEYLNSCVPLAYLGFDRSICTTWLALSALPWLGGVAHDLEPVWTQTSQRLAPALAGHRDALAACFAKFPTPLYRQWALDVGAEILRTPEAPEAAATAVIRLVPWLARHGKVYRELISDLMTRILASGSPLLAAELTRHGCDLVCALSGKTNVVNPPEEGLVLRCVGHGLAGEASAASAPAATKTLTSAVSEDVGLFLLEFVFDENEHAVAWRVDLLQAVLGHAAQPHSDGLRSAVRKRLRCLTSKSISDGRPVLQRTVLKCCSMLAQFWTDQVVADCLHVLFQLMLSAYSPLMLCWIGNTVKEIAAHLKMSPDVLFSRNTAVVVEILLSSGDIEWRTNLLSLAPDMFHLSGVSQCLHLMLPVLLPRLALELPAGPSPFFDEVCTILNKSRSEVLGKFFSCIYVHLLLHCTVDVQNAVLGHIEETTRLKLLELRAPNFQTVHNDLLSRFHSHGERCLEAFTSFAAAEDKSMSSARQRSRASAAAAAAASAAAGTTDVSIGDYLRPRFLGFLVHLDNKLVSKSVSDDVKVEALASLPGVLRLMGKANVTAVRLKILATLRTGLQLNYEPFQRLNAAAWEAFVRHIDVDQLGPLISQITVSVLPLYQFCSETIRSILYFIIVENGHQLKEHLEKIHFLPELTGLEDIVYSLKELGSSNSSVAGQLACLTGNASHEDFEVRLQALAQLRRLLLQHPAAIRKMVIGTDETADAAVTRLVTALLRGCSVREEEMLLLYGQCFGLLAAIDPGRLNFNGDEQRRDGASEYSVELIDDEFVFRLLTQLARSFLAPRNAQTLDCCSFTIQEVLKIERCSDADSALWRRFPAQMAVAFAPLLTSRYVLKQQPPPAVPFPVYRSPSGNNYAGWLITWTGHLIDRVSGHRRAADIFRSCLPTLRRDMHVNLFLLPYVVMTALWSAASAEERGRIAEEIMAVLLDRGLHKSPRRTMKRFSSNTSTHVDAAATGSGQESSGEAPAASDLHQSCMQAIFYLLDHMNKWLKKKHSVRRSKKERTTAAQDHEFKVVQELVASIPNDVLARASFQCRAYARAVLHLEAHVKDNPSQLGDQLGLLQKLYVALDEPDGVAGVCAIRTHEPSLEENITAYGATGQLQDAFSCYERISQRDDCSLEFYQGMLRCLLNLDLPQGALTMANGLLQNCPDWRRNLDDYRAECCWRLGQWDALEDVVRVYEKRSAAAAAAAGATTGCSPAAASSTSTLGSASISASTASSGSLGWGVGLGQALLAAKSNDLARMEATLRAVRLDLMRVISAVNLERNSYPRAYENLVKLHVLAELESAVALVEHAPRVDQFRTQFAQLLEDWDARLSAVQASVRFMEPILSMRRVALKLIQPRLEAQQPALLDVVEAEIGKSWLVSARLARKASHFQRAHILQLVASTSPSPPPAIYMEQAKLHWAKGEHDQAITVLKRGIDKRFGDVSVFKSRNSLDPAQLAGSDVLDCLKAKLLLARYYDQTGNADMSSIIAYYREVVEINKNWEDGWFFLASYYDRLWNSLDERDAHGDVARYIISNLGKSMQYGSHFIYQAMPRMLSLWMELGTLEMEVNGAATGKTTPASRRQDSRTKLAEINKLVANFVDVIPPYKFLTAFPQLISRICHPHPEVAQLLRQIISKVLIAYPQQCMWMMISVMKSSYNVRAKRCKEILDVAAQTQPQLRAFFGDATNLADRLVELANKHVDNGVMTLSVAKSFKLLPKLLSAANFSKIMVPLQWAMSVTLPATAGAHAHHQAFPRQPVYIVGVDDTVEVMQSLQKPKKIALRGSDGQSYVFLCKPKDDLRKDFRLMEFNQLISRYLVRDPESRKRNLRIRTYAVVPLNEECGLIEWIPNLIGLRHILNRIYKDKGLQTSPHDLKRLMPQLRDTLQKKKDIFVKELLPRYPAVFSEWFLSVFPDPQDWFLARLNYVRTIAVMSMIGFVVGLGDRHGENILFDAVCGDAVHVDLSCLFNKGETFEWPEKVPFRLTHNMIEGMGPTGIEGSYRKCCEVTLRVLRQQADTLLSVLKPFVHDPLVEWSKQTVKGRTDLGEIKNEQALEHVGNIERRLQGFLHFKSKTKIINLPLSVEGQVNQLIAEATNIDNLAQMYIGWAAYM